MDNRIFITVNVNESGHLYQTIAKNKLHLIHELTIHGYFNCYADKSVIGSMCNTLDESGKRTGGQLDTIDLSKAKIASSWGEPDYRLGYDTFKNCITLKKIILSKLYDINAKGFSGCVSLTSIEYMGCYHFVSKKGVLYQIGRWETFQNQPKYKQFVNGTQILVKYPAAKQDVEDIDFTCINKIEDYAFEDFKGTDLYLPGIPPSCTELAFFNVDTSKITLHVNKDFFNSYWSHPVWGNFQIVVDEK